MRTITARASVCLALFASLGAATASGPEGATKVPVGRNVLINGHFEAEEWSDARAHDLGDGYRLFAKQDDRYLYLAVEFGEDRHSGLEIIFDPEPGDELVLHVSGNLGIRRRSDEGWSDTEWNAEGWAANVVQLTHKDGKMQIVEPESFEIQIDKALLGSEELRVRLELRRPAVALPRAPSPTTEEAGPAWLALSL